MNRYHLHIVDSGDHTSTVNAATLFAHFTLRCGQFRNCLLLSASTTGAKQPRDPANPPPATQQSAAALAAAPSTTGELSTEDPLLAAAETLLQCEGYLHDGGEEEPSWRDSLASVKDRIVPYGNFSRSFIESEVLLSMSKGPYFDFIATADVASFDYLLDYYMAPQLEAAPWSASVPRMTVEKKEGLMERKKRVGLIHILCSELPRAGHLLQRFMELLLDVDTVTAQGVASRGADDQRWIDRVDNVILQMYQLLGVDVLFALV
ncbi:hypothetical protein ERJ75_001327000 [Trypanosoma vivax]|uniref:Uncharacterized protein n=1 Tax=Trypanosoma vivax (strain Y486) TaxID=1055687 RepID=G0U132_TRYVY|nr:hypothetical protein TRVL_03561 [Trypanosoma vivax]KAH8608090.1 hypothetical protein ERJ75_001327000 [Trypanosoma vivax]CCC49787.1 conserved hypothetical protein [Trypanosoma vivax Y486]